MARVIRGRARVVPGEVVDASARAQAILREARTEAERLREAIRAEESTAAREDARAGLAAAMLGVEIARKDAVDEVRSEVLALSMAVAKNILGEAFEADPERVRTLVDEALGRVARSRGARVRVHPDDAAHLGDLEAEVVQDESLSRGDCIVESDLGDVDGRIETRLAHLARALERTPEHGR